MLWASADLEEDRCAGPGRAEDYSEARSRMQTRLRSPGKGPRAEPCDDDMADGTPTASSVPDPRALMRDTRDAGR